MTQDDGSGFSVLCVDVAAPDQPAAEARRQHLIHDVIEILFRTDLTDDFINGLLTDMRRRGGKTGTRRGRARRGMRNAIQPLIRDVVDKQTNGVLVKVLQPRTTSEARQTIYAEVVRIAEERAQTTRVTDRVPRLATALRQRHAAPVA